MKKAAFLLTVLSGLTATSTYTFAQDIPPLLANNPAFARAGSGKPVDISKLPVGTPLGSIPLNAMNKNNAIMPPMGGGPTLASDQELMIATKNVAPLTKPLNYYKITIKSGNLESSGIISDNTTFNPKNILIKGYLKGATITVDQNLKKTENITLEPGTYPIINQVDVKLIGVKDNKATLAYQFDQSFENKIENKNINGITIQIPHVSIYHGQGVAEIEIGKTVSLTQDLTSNNDKTTKPENKKITINITIEKNK